MWMGDTGRVSARGWVAPEGGSPEQLCVSREGGADGLCLWQGLALVMWPW